MDLFRWFSDRQARRQETASYGLQAMSGRLNATRFVEFLKAFMRNRRRAVFLVIDGLPAHKARLVAAYV